MSNCKLLAKVRVNKAPALLFFFRLLFMAITFLSLDLLLAHPAVAEPLYVGDFDGPLERSAEQSPGLIRVDLSDGNPFAPQGELPGGFPSNMPRRAKAFLDFQKVEKTSKGQLFIRSADKKIFLLKLSEAQVKLFFGPPANVRPYEKLVKTAHLDQVFEYPCYCDSRINKLILGFEKQVVRRAVLVPPSSKAEE